MARKVLHFDLDAFFCAVEEIKNPDLRGKAFAVGGKPAERGVVSSCSYAARKYGIRSAMPMAQAQRKCPPLRIVSPDYPSYRNASKEVMARLHQITPIVEQLSIDEAFLDVSDLREPSLEIAKKLQNQINTALKLPCSVGGAANKLVAKIANDYGKSQNKRDVPPNAITIVQPGEEQAFLAPLPVIALWGVGPKTARRLEGLGLLKIGDLISWSEEVLASHFGKYGHNLFQFARGIDNSPVEISRETKSISRETTFSKDIADRERLQGTLRTLSRSIVKSLRAQGLRGKTIKLKLRWSNFETFTRQRTLPAATDKEEEICSAAEKLFNQHWPEGKRVRLIGVGISSLDNNPVQLSLWDAPSERSQRLQQAITALRERYGDQAIRRGGNS